MFLLALLSLMGAEKERRRGWRERERERGGREGDGERDTERERTDIRQQNLPEPSHLTKNLKTLTTLRGDNEVCSKSRRREKAAQK